MDQLKYKSEKLNISQLKFTSEQLKIYQLKYQLTYTSCQLDIDSPEYVPFDYETCPAERLDEEYSRVINAQYRGYGSRSFDWDGLCRNPNSLKLINRIISTVIIGNEDYTPNFYKLKWKIICENKYLIPIIIQLFNRDVDHHLLYWEAICKNEGAYPILDKIYKTEGLTSPKLYLNHLLNNKGAFKFIDTILFYNIDNEDLWLQCAYDGMYDIKAMAKLKPKEWRDEHCSY